MEWVTDFDNGCHVKKEVNNLNLEIQYLPEVNQENLSGKKVILKLGMNGGEDILKREIQTTMRR